MISLARRLACVCLTAVMGLSVGASHTLAKSNKNAESSDGNENATDVSFENITGQMDLSDIVLKNLSPSVLKNAGLPTNLDENSKYTVIVRLDGKSILDLKSSKQSASDYLTSFSGDIALGNIASQQERVLNELSQMGVSYKLIHRYSTIMNAMALEVNYSDFQKLAGVNSVKSVVLSSSYAYPEAITSTSLDVTENPSNVYATGIYNSQGVIDKYGIDGSGMTVAILDTGLDYAHEAFEDNLDTSKISLTKEKIASLMQSKQFASESLSQAKGDSLTADNVWVNNKVPFAYDYADDDADVYPSYSTHGTHVAGIVGGKADSYTNKDGHIATYIDENGVEQKLSFRGVAPEAQLIICKVFTDDFASRDLGGAVTEDILAALEDCVNLNVDIINMSLGSTSGFSSLVIKNGVNGLNDTEGDLMNETYASIKDAGINLICAASNEYSSAYGSASGTNLASNPDSGVVGSPSTYTGAMSVASINGQYSRFMTVDVNSTAKAIYYLEANDGNGNPKDFLKDLNVGSESKKLKYVLVGGKGEAVNYMNLKSIFADKSEGPVIAVVTRGKTTFQDKVQEAMAAGADAVIMVNNVSGTVRISLGDIKNPIPTVSVTYDSGILLTQAANNGIGYITLDESFQAGPFMNDYSSWGSTPDLKLKPDITAHGGEITSTVPGGYDEQSGTSMASPNLAGFAALLRSYLKNSDNFRNYSANDITTLSNQIMMSTATIVYDQSLLPYSPRKQGAGLATLANVFGTNAYLYTIEGKDNGAEDGRPKVELGEDKEEKGKYEIVFYANNFGNTDLKFTLESIFMTESLSSDGVAVAEKASLFDDIPTKWTVNGESKSEGAEITIPAKTNGFKIVASLELSDAEKAGIKKNFENGMFIEGFIRLNSATNGAEDGQCSLSLPFMGFFGDWSSAPMLDYSAFEIAEFKKDTSLNDDERPQERVFATQAYSTYYHQQYTVPMGSYVYLQDESADQIYTTEEYCAISKWDEFISEEAKGNYLTTTKIRALYAGLLRNAEVVSYVLYDDITGEQIKSDYVYRVSKAYSAGGSPVAANVELNLDPVELGLVSNGKYRLEFYFYFDDEDIGNPDKYRKDNEFSMTFYVDYEAPVLLDSRIRYYDYKDGNKDKQRIYLDLDVFDNHYLQSALLCYVDSNDELVMATEYVTPVHHSVKNGVNTVSIEITDFYKTYKDNLYVQFDDYALNHSLYSLRLSTASNNLPDTFTVDSTLSLNVNEAKKINLNYTGDANLSEFTWESDDESIVKVKNGEVFGVSEGTTVITVGNGKITRLITVTVSAGNISLNLPDISFGLIETAGDGLKNATGAVSVYAGETIQLKVVTDPWYYGAENLELRWSTTDEDGSIATVDQNGVVTTKGEGMAVITATVMIDGKPQLKAATVTLNVEDPFRVSNFILTKYNGPGGYVEIPADENIMSIGEEAFKDNKKIEYVVIPKTVVQIGKRAFKGCTNLKAVYFISEEAGEVPTAKLSSILAGAFEDCTALELVDFTNVKTISVVDGAFRNCISLATIKKPQAIGSAYDFAFYGCKSLKEFDMSKLYKSGSFVFAGCESLTKVTTAYYSAIGAYMFSGCTRLTEIEINTPNVASNAFSGVVFSANSKLSACTALRRVNFGKGADRALDFVIGSDAFNGCINLSGVTFASEKYGITVKSIGDQAFANCLALSEITIPNAGTVFGDRVFYNTQVTITDNGIYTTDSFGAVYCGTTLIKAPARITAEFKLKEGTKEIGPHAFSTSVLSGVTSIEIPETVEKIGEGAFAHTAYTSITLPESLTMIPDYLFYGCSRLVSVQLPDNVVSIGERAFEGCVALTGIDFNTKLVSIGDYAFSTCQELTSVTLPDSVKILGEAVFYGCSKLTTVNIPAVEQMGEYTFWMCVNLETVTFAPDATTIGKSTFYPGNEGTNIYKSSLKNVTLPSNITEIDENTFFYCSELERIDLKNVTVLRDYAFANCSKLAFVTGLENVTYIGSHAFENCYALVTLNLAEATDIGDYAFNMSNGTSNFSSVSIPKAVHIGRFSFFGGRQLTVDIPATLVSLGDAAFAGSANLQNFTVADGNENFTVIDGVLYRILDSGYELTAYPSAKANSEFVIADKTVALAGYSMAHLAEKVVKKVVLPYSVKTIGSSAFFESGIEEYVFEGVTAPVLLAEDFDNTEYIQNGLIINSIGTIKTLFYLNFQSAFMPYSNLFVTPDKSSLKITYPENGVGYDSYIYRLYFGEKTVGGEVLEDNTRSFKEIMDGILGEYENPVQTVQGWASLENNDANKKLVADFSELVKSAHRYYNYIGESQLAILDTLSEEAGYYYNLLTSIEQALKPVKNKFGLNPKVDSISVSADSNYKSAYTEGEAFDKTGLIITILYDDFTTVNVGADDITVVSDYANSLTPLNRYVIVSVEGESVRVSVTVTAAEEKPDDEGDSSGCGGCASTTFLGGSGGSGLMALGIIALAAVAGVVARKRKAN